MNSLIDEFEKTISGRGLFCRGQGILVAVSGGLDSMVLLHLMNRLAQVHGWQLTVAHLNHKLRGKSSEADARLVKRKAKELGWQAVIGVAKVRDLARREKLSLEMAARRARHEFLAHTADKLGIHTVALAHHADDQLELFFLRLLRGSGSQGLQGMRWRNPSPVNKRIELVRPLLGQTRATLGKYAVENKVRFREDASNASLDIQRNRIRHELLPLLRKRYQPALETVIARVLEITQAEAEFITESARSYLSVLPVPKLGSDPSPLPSPIRKGRGRSVSSLFAKKSLGKGQTDKLSWAGAAFGDLPVAVQRRSLQLQLLGSGILPDFDLIEQLRLQEGRRVCVSWDKLASSDRTREPLFVIRDSNGLVRSEKAIPAPFPNDSALVYLVGDSGKVHFEGIQVGWERKAGRVRELGQREATCEWFDADRVGDQILLRHWRPGDRFQPIGMPRSVKLQDFLTNQKIPRERRHRLLLAVTAQGEVFWVEGMRISERFKLTKSTNRRLQWRWQRL